jgi:hypothetical protein
MAQKPDSPAASPARSAASLEADLTPRPRRELAPAADEDLDPPSPPPFDINGFDPSAYKWVPVLRRPRKDGWTPQRQKKFIAALADSGCVEHAAIQVGMSVTSCYRLRRSPGAENFAAAWDLALQHAARQLLDVAFDRAYRGTDEPVFDRDGNCTGRRHRQNDRLMMFLLRAYMPERFRHAHRDWRAPDEALPPPAPPMADVLRRLEPAMPPEPHKLMPPDELEDALLGADLMDGRLPHYHRGHGDAERALGPSPEVERELDRLLHGDVDRPPVAKRR